MFLVEVDSKAIKLEGRDIIDHNFDEFGIKSEVKSAGNLVTQIHVVRKDGSQWKLAAFEERDESIHLKHLLSDMEGKGFG